YAKHFYLQRILTDAFGENAVRLKEGSSPTVTVSLTVEKQEERTIQFPTDKITVTGVTGDFEYQFESETIDIVIYGLPTNVEFYDDSYLVVVLRVKSTDLTPGTHSVTLDVTGLGQLKAKEAKTNLIIKAKVNEEPESSTPTSEESSS
ncbi:MAG: hypothetical protein II096_04000, partial [Erysipelotrichaceae bacterium]|nr:hypothetical protein [Erysipelotrichaceae bacterium]